MDLKRAGYCVELFERGRLLGGRATSFELGGIEVDNGQHVFLACCSAFIDFVRAVGMGDDLYLQDRFEAVVFGLNGVTSRLRARALPAPYHLLSSLMTYKHLRLGDRVRLGRGLFRMMHQTTASTSATSFAAWLAYNDQRDAQLRAFWEPFFIPALNAPLACVSQADGEFVLSTAFLREADAARFGWSRVPLARIAAAAADRLDDIHLSTAVTSLRVTSNERVELRIKEEWRRFDGAVLAVAPPQLARLLGEPEAFGIRSVDAYRAYPIIDVHLWHSVTALDFEFAALIESPVQWIFAKAPGYLCCSMSAANELGALTTAELTDRCWEDVRRFVPAMRNATLVRSAVTRNPVATFLVPPGMARTANATAHPNLTIAGSWTDTRWPDTMESAVRSGRTAAAALRVARCEVTLAS